MKAFVLGVITGILGVSAIAYLASRFKVSMKLYKKEDVGKDPWDYLRENSLAGECSKVAGVNGYSQEGNMRPFGPEIKVPKGSFDFKGCAMGMSPMSSAEVKKESFINLVNSKKKMEDSQAKTGYRYSNDDLYGDTVDLDEVEEEDGVIDIDDIPTNFSSDSSEDDEDMDA